ncbi:MAG TPA: hypothetical protein VFQ45_16185 [Longimicrobium sp.]|nr:hypothetical protein [Longimicrobium sp.]
MTKAEWEKDLAEFRTDVAYLRGLTEQAKLAQRGLAPLPVIPRPFPGIGAVMLRLAPPPSVPAHEVGTLRGKRPGRLKFRLARRSRSA